MRIHICGCRVVDQLNLHEFLSTYLSEELERWLISIDVANNFETRTTSSTTVTSLFHS